MDMGETCSTVGGTKQVFFFVNDIYESFLRLIYMVTYSPLFCGENVWVSFACQSWL